MAHYLLIRQDIRAACTFCCSNNLSVFHVTRLLLFRPFLLLCLELKRRGIKDILKERNGGVEMTVLYEAAERSVKAAIDIIDFCDSMFSLQIGTEVPPPDSHDLSDSLHL